jgi:hypothetical protein
LATSWVPPTMATTSLSSAYWPARLATATDLVAPGRPEELGLCDYLKTPYRRSLYV